MSFGGYSDELQQTQEVKRILLADDLQYIDDKETLWAWVMKATESVFNTGLHRVCNSTLPDPLCAPSGIGSETIPVAILMLRQWRVKIQTCGNVNGLTSRSISTCDLTVLPCRCTREYNSEESTGAEYGTNVVFISDSARGLPTHPLDLTTNHLTYNSADQFSISISLTNSLDDVLANLTDYKNAGWTDEQTRAVSLEALFYNPDSEQFIRSSFYAEYFQTGLGVAGDYIEPPFVLQTFGQDRARTALSLITMFYIIPFLYWLYQSLYFRMFVKKDLHVVGEVYQIAHVAVLSAWTYYQGKMWDLSAVMSNGDFYQQHLAGDFGRWGETEDQAENALMFHYSTQYALYGRRYTELLALLLVISWLRIFKFLQHIQQLNMLSETTRIAAFDVFKLAFIFLYCVLAYSLAGSLVFQSEMQEFETPTHASSTLLRMFFMEHEPDYRKMRDMQPFWAPVFVVTFFLLCYFMLLNMVLAVIVSSFTQVQTAQETAARQLALREEAILDEEILILRNRSTSVALAVASRPSRISRTYRKVLRGFERFMELVVGWLTADNTQREKAIQLAKDHCARDLRIPRVVLKEHPEYLNRVSITKEELKRVFAKLLSDSDLDNIFLGVQKRVFTQENTHVLIVQAMSELALSIQQKLEALEKSLATVSQNPQPLPVPPQDTAVAIQDLKQQLKAARAEVSRLNKEKARSAHTASQASVQQHLQDLNAEREYLVAQLAKTEIKNLSSYR
eukprot:TRINITY_DN20920_c0_g1_i1.p1 TRINITY_DN20920_c0_g1~~TRINITY_DN20920_c0_g1_i1.p1  ORF type:complete len:849 (+),score=201.39 TRINITY_DN20920_c0_g1_i1:344-2548(+)